MLGVVVLVLGLMMMVVIRFGEQRVQTFGLFFSCLRWKGSKYVAFTRMKDESKRSVQYNILR